jgi:ABC-type spermidine/putrescine transport system permease subunit II
LFFNGNLQRFNRAIGDAKAGAIEEKILSSFMTILTAGIVLAIVFLTCTNGANDNFKGEATLFLAAALPIVVPR